MIPPLLIPVLEAAPEGSALVAFDTVADEMLNQHSGLMTTCKALCAVFCMFLLAGVVRDILQETAGGHGEVPLGRIIRPFFVMLLLVSFPLLRTLCNKAFGATGRGAAKAVVSNYIKKPSRDIDLTRTWNESSYKAADGGYTVTHEPGKTTITTDWNGGDGFDQGFDDMLGGLEGWLQKQADKLTRFRKRVHWFIFEVTDVLTDGIGGLILCICQYIVCCYASLMLAIMAALGPIAITFSALPPWKDASKQFFGKYITYSLWLPIIGITVSAASAAAQSVGGWGAHGGGVLLEVLRAALKLFVYLGATHMIFQTGQVANDAVSLADTSGLGGATGAGLATAGAAAGGAVNIAKELVGTTLKVAKGAVAAPAVIAGAAAVVGGMGLKAASSMFGGEAGEAPKEDPSKKAMDTMKASMKKLTDENSRLLADNGKLKTELDGSKSDLARMTEKYNKKVNKQLSDSMTGARGSKGNSMAGQRGRHRH